jgi:hypothetical protein
VIKPTQIPDWLDHVGPGWAPILTQLHADVMALDPEYTVGQVKQKFGGLRAYLNFRHPGVPALVRVAEEQSMKTCEDCGNPGHVRSRPPRHSWMLALCDLCVEKEPEPW